ncbi:MAG TPA: hypothetical protein VMF89_24870 [Polyangiales bacterium]|nr:hypothetical protein [Polyangiales bacterium]
MYAELLADRELPALLLKFDEDLAAECRARGCRICGGTVHSARYRRKPRGGPLTVPADYERRFSFCCAVDGCRTRATPPSLRYLSRKVYLATAVVLISAMRCGATPRRLRYLEQMLGVSRRTIYRWRAWWCELLPETAFWRAASALLVPPVDRALLPAALLERFIGSMRERLIALLRFLAPLSTGGLAVHAT